MRTIAVATFILAWLAIVAVQAAIFPVTVGPAGNRVFSPASLTINVNDTVTWTWASKDHMVTSGSNCRFDSLFSSGRTKEPTGYVYSHTFPLAGTFRYFCDPHCPNMVGTIRVVDPSTSSPTTPPASPTPSPTTTTTTTAPGSTSANSTTSTPTTSSPSTTSSKPSTTPTTSPAPTQTGATTTPPTTSSTSPPFFNCTSCSYSNAARTLSVSWRINATAIQFSVVARTLGWFAIGVNPRTTMAGTDIFWVQLTSSQVGLVDRKADSHRKPPMDSQQDLVLESSSLNSTHSFVVFSRLLNTGDARDIAISTTPLNLIWAMTSSRATPPSAAGGDWAWSQHSSTGSAGPMNFFIGGAQGNSNSSPYEMLRQIHGILMLLAWGFCAVVGTFIARFLKSQLGVWFWVHVVVQICTVLLGLGGFVVIVVYTVKSGGKQFDPTGYHRVIGLVVTILMTLQPILGQVANLMFDPNRKKTPFWPDKVHWILGFVLVIAGLVTIHLGLSMYCVSTRTMVFWALAVCVIVISFLVFDILAWVCLWGGYLSGAEASHSPESAAAGESAPRVALIVGECVCVAALTIFVVIAMIGIATQPAPTPFYSGCLKGDVVVTRSWWLFFCFGLALICLAILASFVVWFMCVRVKGSAGHSRRSKDWKAATLRDNSDAGYSLMQSK